MIGQATSYAKTAVRAETLNRQTVMSSVNDALNEVPGVVVSEADATGSSVWGTQISMRGFVTNRDTQQIGTTIDGLPNGGSGYGGGSLANRYIDTLDLETVEVSQGTADISSRSNEALGGTLNFLTSDPLQDSRLRFVVGAGDNDARKYYVRYDTGLLGGHTRAWVSASSSKVHDWIDGTGHASNDHIAGKFITELDRWTLTGYLSYNDADEPEYTSVSPKGFATNPDRDNRSRYPHRHSLPGPELPFRLACVAREHLRLPARGLRRWQRLQGLGGRLRAPHARPRRLAATVPGAGQR